MSDPYAWLDGDKPQATQVDQPAADPYAWLDGDKPAARSRGTPTFDIDFSADVPTVRRQIGKLPKRQRKAALRQWADVFVPNERKENAGVVQNVTDLARHAIRGTPLGPYMDEATAGLAAAQNAVGLGGAPYDEVKAYQDALNRHSDKDSTRLGAVPLSNFVNFLAGPAIDTANKATGSPQPSVTQEAFKGKGRELPVTVGGLTKVAGGVASAPFLPAVKALEGASYVPQLVNQGLTGGLYGLIYGAGEGNTLAERGQNAALGGFVGGGLGLATATAAAAGRKIAGSRQGPVPDELQGLDPRAAREVNTAIKQDAISPRRLQHVISPGRRTTALGDRGMIADLGHNTSARTSGIIKRGGDGGAHARSAITKRDNTAINVLDDAATATMGPKINMVEAAEAAAKGSKAAANPLYDQFRKGPQLVTANRPMSKQLARTLNSSSASPALRTAKEYMDLKGKSVSFDTGLNVNEYLDHVKRALDDLASVPTDKAGLFKRLSKTIRKELDEFLSPGAPERSVYAKARAASAEGKQYAEGLEFGKKAMSKNITGDMVDAELARSSPAKAMAIREAARGDLNNLARTSTTQFGDTPSPTLRKLIGPDSRQKIRSLANAGREATGVNPGRPIVTGDPKQPWAATTSARTAAPTMTPSALARVVDRESHFKRLYSRGVQGSQAAADANTIAALPATPKAFRGADFRPANATGLALEQAAKLGDALRTSAITEANEKMVLDMAKILTAQGPTRDRIIQGLMKMQAGVNISDARKALVGRVIEIIGRGSQPAIVDAATRAGE